MIPYNRYYVPKFHLDSLIYSHYIKYDHLINVILNEFRNTPEANCTHINLFIDVYSIIKTFYRRSDFIINEEQKYALASGIINMAAHYREYFRSRHNTKTDIFIISSFNDNRFTRETCSEYKPSIDFNRDEVTDYIVENIKILDAIVPYLPNIYFKHYDTTTTGVAILDIINYNHSHGNNDPNIILSKDIVNYQLVNVNSSKTIILRAKKKMVEKYNGLDTEDHSFIINRNNLLKVFLDSRTSEQTKNASSDILNKRMQLLNQINPEFLSALLTVTRVPEYGMQSILQIPYTISLFYKMIVEDKFVLNQYNSNIENMVEIISGYIKKKINKDQIVRRFKVLDIPYQYNMFKIANIEVYEKVDDLYNANMIKEINEKFFKHYPLDLNVL